MSLLIDKEERLLWAYKQGGEIAHYANVILCGANVVDAVPAVHGQWTEKEVWTSESAHIDEWQSAKCSVCGKYHTTPYMYYFDDYNFCPHCGAKMDTEDVSE